MLSGVSGSGIETLHWEFLILLTKTKELMLTWKTTCNKKNSMNHLSTKISSLWQTNPFKNVKTHQTLSKPAGIKDQNVFWNLAGLYKINVQDKAMWAECESSSSSHPSSHQSSLQTFRWMCWLMSTTCFSLSPSIGSIFRISVNFQV